MNFVTLAYSATGRQLVAPVKGLSGLPFANRDDVREFFAGQHANLSGARAAVERLRRAAAGGEVAAWLLGLLRDVLGRYRPDVEPEGYQALAAKLFDEDREEVGDFEGSLRSGHRRTPTAARVSTGG